MLRLIFNLLLNIVTLGWWERRLGERRDYKLHIDPNATFSAHDFYANYDDVPAKLRSNHPTKPKNYR